MKNKNIPIQYFFGSIIIFLTVLIIPLLVIPQTAIPLLAGIILAYIFDPLIDYLEEKGYSRQKAVFLFFLMLGLFFLLFFTILVPYLVIQLIELIENLPELLIKVITWVSARLNLESSAIKTKVTELLSQQYNAENFSRLAKIIKESFSSTAGVIISAAGTIIIPVFFYYFLLDIDNIKHYLFKLIPPTYRRFFAIRLTKVDNILNGFIRGQLLVGLSLSILYAAGLSIAGIKYGLLIGFAAGILNIVPYLGVGIGLISSLFMAAFSHAPIFQVIAVVVIFALVQIIEGFILTPKIVGNKVGLNPLAAFVSILVGGELFGIAGMLAAIPAGGIVKIILRDIKAAYLKSGFYRKDIR